MLMQFDYCNSILVGLSKFGIHQSDVNYACFLNSGKSFLQMDINDAVSTASVQHTFSVYILHLSRSVRWP